jgi:hypothetical protein
MVGRAVVTTEFSAADSKVITPRVKMMTQNAAPLDRRKLGSSFVNLIVSSSSCSYTVLAENDLRCIETKLRTIFYWIDTMETCLRLLQCCYTVVKRCVAVAIVLQDYLESTQPLVSDVEAVCSSFDSQFHLQVPSFRYSGVKSVDPQHHPTLIRCRCAARTMSTYNVNRYETEL